MGVLEDAIRDHLDLKKRHGGSEEELRRQEAEALGPARREAEATPEEPAEPPAPEPADTLLPPQAEDAEPSSVPAEELFSEETEVYQAPDEPQSPPQEDAPERDRLTPEQKPPSDFDFE
jgi:hypothetical protein